MGKSLSLKNIPSVTECDKFLVDQKLPHGKQVREYVNYVLNKVRQEIINDSGGIFSINNSEIMKRVADEVQIRSNTIKRAINATGIVIHTNLGRAPLSKDLIMNALPKLCSYSTLELDLVTGKRGARDSRIRTMLRILSGAEDAMVVNNNAAATFLMLKGLTKNIQEEFLPEVIVSRGELVEIGGSFRVPEIMSEAGVKMVEIGTTNRCRISDYEKAFTKNTAAILKVHPSNYKILGFTESVSVENLSKLAQSKGVPCFYDWGSGSFYQFKNSGLSKYKTVRQELSYSPDLLTFSGDKILGGIQAGILLGKAGIIQKLRKSPLYRTLRLDKVNLTLMEATLEAYMDIRSLPNKVPTIFLLEQTAEEISDKAKDFLSKINLKDKALWRFEIKETESKTGGGALPDLNLCSTAIVLSHPQWSVLELQKWFRSQPIPVITRVHEDHVWLDFRTIFKNDLDELLKVFSRLILS